MKRAQKANPQPERCKIDGKIVGAHVQGASHKRSGLECQDKYKSSKLPDGTIILTVADGHGSSSCPYSKDGADLASSVFRDVMQELYKTQAFNRGELITYLNREGSTKIAQAIDEAWKKQVRKMHQQKERGLPPELTGDTYPEGKEKSSFALDDSTKSINHQLWAPIYQQYGTTLLGIMIAEDFQFAMQIGDGDICYVDKTGFQRVIEGDKILGVETHSLSKINAWEKAISVLQRQDLSSCLPVVYLLSTDGFCNSHSNEAEFEKTCIAYYKALNQYGVAAVLQNLGDWLKETSNLGCGDDITVLMAYYSCT